METRKPNLTIKQPPKSEDDNNRRHSLGPDLLWEEIK